MDPSQVKGHRARLRRRFMRSWGKDFEPYELLELLLAFAIPRRDTKPLAKDLLKRFGCLASVLEAEPGELLSQEGVGEVSVVLLKLVHALALSTQDPVQRATDYLASPEEVAKYFRTLLRGLREERFLVACLDPKNRIRQVRELQQGTVDQAVVYPRRVAEAALEARAKSVVVVHNHPSGDCQPSEDDVRLTRELVITLSTVGVVLLDHVIVGADSYFSFRARGLL